MQKFHYHKQEKEYTCGAAAMKMALEYLGIEKTEKQLIRLLKTEKIRGTYTKNFASVLKKLKINFVIKSNTTIYDLRHFQNKGYLIIVNYFLPAEKCDHYAVLRKIDWKFVYLFDPWYGPEHRYKRKDFLKNWHSDFNFEKEKRWFIALKK
jgi:predicted double-glycine peptidase